MIDSLPSVVAPGALVAVADSVDGVDAVDSVDASVDSVDSVDCGRLGGRGRSTRSTRSTWRWMPRSTPWLALEAAVTSLDAGANRVDSGVVAAPDAAGVVATAGSVDDGT